MNCSVILKVIALSILFFQLARGSFIYGEPCNERNTAYLMVETWSMPNHTVRCLDITGMRKQLLGTVNIKKYMEFLQEVQGTETLYSDHINVTRFPISIVRHLPNVEMIDLSGNEIRKIPHKMFLLAPKLNKLLLSDNRVMIPKKKPLLASMTLRTLMLSDNGIYKLYKFTFMKLPALEVLYLDSNNLRTISPLFNSVPTLRYLHVGRNFLTTIPPKQMISRSLTHYITKSQRKSIEKRMERRKENRVKSRFNRWK